MFIRYRKLESGGRRPEGVRAKIFCLGRCERNRRRCPVTPRCRWVIGLHDDDTIVRMPYRLEVSIVENHRVEGKVRQQHVAVLGSIDGWLLPEFWAGIPDMDKADDWDIRSLRARVTFWETVNPRLAGLANRLDPKAVRMAIHARIPWPKQPERELVEAQADFRFWQSGYETATTMIGLHDRQIEHANKAKAELQQHAITAAARAAKAAARLASFDRQGGKP